MDAQDEREFAEFVVRGEHVVFIPQISETLRVPEFRRLQETRMALNLGVLTDLGQRPILARGLTV